MANKTSTAVEELMGRYQVRTVLSEGRIENIHNVYSHFPSIAEKYLRMEEALRKISRIGQDYSGQMAEVDDAREALSFDPLSDAK